VKLSGEWRSLTAAVGYFTRLPAPVNGAGLADAITYFPLVGWLVGGAAAATWWVAARFWPPSIAAGLCLVVPILLTGAMHEDGWSDFCDGFGGGFTRDKTLTIMKDSHAGAFGVVGLVLLLGLKWQALAALPTMLVPAVLLAAHSASRAAAATMMATDDYARPEGDTSKARPLVTRLRGGRLLFVVITGVLPTLILPPRFAWSLGVILVLRLALGRWIRRRLGGYTGDCLGAIEQVAELGVYLTCVALA
jgi:adenosylcobinamide-GDP ribazoletransferase